MRIAVAQHPQFLLTFSDDMPQKIRLRKRITAWPLRLTFHADYSRHVSSACSCDGADAAQGAVLHASLSAGAELGG